MKLELGTDVQERLKFPIHAWWRGAHRLFIEMNLHGPFFNFEYKFVRIADVVSSRLHGSPIDPD